MIAFMLIDGSYIRFFSLRRDTFSLCLLTESDKIQMSYLTCAESVQERAEITFQACSFPVLCNTPEMPAF